MYDTCVVVDPVASSVDHESMMTFDPGDRSMPSQMVDPQGVVWCCGCKHTKLGHVWHNDVLDGYNCEFAHFGGKDPQDTCQDSSSTYPLA